MTAYFGQMSRKSEAFALAVSVCAHCRLNPRHRCTEIDVLRHSDILAYSRELSAGPRHSEIGRLTIASK